MLTEIESVWLWRFPAPLHILCSEVLKQLRCCESFISCFDFIIFIIKDVFLTSLNLIVFECEITVAIQFFDSSIEKSKIISGCQASLFLYGPLMFIIVFTATIRAWSSPAVHVNTVIAAKPRCCNPAECGFLVLLEAYVAWKFLRINGAFIDMSVNHDAKGINTPQYTIMYSRLSFPSLAWTPRQPLLPKTISNSKLFHRRSVQHRWFRATEKWI